MWVARKYYSAGYHLGSGGLGIAVLIDDVIRQYQETIRKYDEA